MDKLYFHVAHLQWQMIDVVRGDSHEFVLRPADLELVVTRCHTICELVDAEFAWFGVFEVWDTDGRSPTWQRNSKLDSWDKTALPYLTLSLSIIMLFVCCFTIHDMICVTLYVRDCSVLLQMRHSGFDASEHNQGFCIEPYFVYSPPMVAIAW